MNEQGTWRRPGLTATVAVYYYNQTILSSSCGLDSPDATRPLEFPPSACTLHILQLPLSHCGDVFISRKGLLQIPSEHMAVLGILFLYFRLCVCTWWLCACVLAHMYGYIRACRYMCMCVCVRACVGQRLMLTVSFNHSLLEPLK